MTETAQPMAAIDLSQPTLEMTNLEILGNLVKSWSTGDPKYTGGKLYPEPTTPQELVDLLHLLGGDAKKGPHVKKLTIIHYGVDELLLRIPPPAIILETEKRLETTGYRLPSFYLEEPIAGSEPNAAPEAKLRLQAKRIGDYSIAHCE